MKIFESSDEKENYLVSLAVATVVYFFAARYFQNWFYHRVGLVLRPAGLFVSFGPKFMWAEPLEAPLYVLAYLLVPALAWVFTPLVRRMRLKYVLIASAVLGLGVGVVIAPHLLARLPWHRAFSVLHDKGVWHIAW